MPQFKKITLGYPRSFCGQIHAYKYAYIYMHKYV